ncbi:gamma-glutamylcyclotransferase [Agaribacter flavus]|uniref:Gamma-glutamylcyclotransferase n=1 Tax=Agaribacter flavus TaxID=1902781 RepID=A0ABV7FLJ4_9ALTE
MPPFDQEQWKAWLQDKVLVAGYGSLLSADSRRLTSNLNTPTVSVQIKNWSRAWITRAYHENQTYVGALPSQGAWLNAQLVPSQIDAALVKREQDYRLTPITIKDIELTEPSADTASFKEILSNYPIYICETLENRPANQAYKVNFSYLATCLLGCFEKQGVEGMRAFMQTSTGLSKELLFMDNKAPLYPWAANLTPEFEALCKTIVEEYFAKTIYRP